MYTTSKTYIIGSAVTGAGAGVGAREINGLTMSGWLVHSKVYVSLVSR
jgi:hypothetical protein